MLFLFVLLSVSFAATKTCSRKSTQFYALRCCPINRLDFFYPSTAPTLLSYIDRCTKITNQEFRRRFPWITSKDQVEHIIDSNNGPEYLSGCDKDILGNLIIANGIWNNQVGQMCWEDVEAEKTLVYGEIFDFALGSVELCCGSLSPTHYGILVLAVMFPIVLFLIHLLLYSKCESYKERYDDVRMSLLNHA